MNKNKQIMTEKKLPDLKQDCYETMMQKIYSAHAIAELGSIADFNLQLEPDSYAQVFMTLETMLSEIKELATRLEKN